MQFILHFCTDKPLSLPIGYHSEVQGLIYHILSANSNYSAFLHNQGYTTEGRNYKLFVYSLLNGRYEVHMPSITFVDSFSLEVRSPIDEFCDVFVNALMRQNQFELNHQTITLSSYEVRREEIHTDSVQIEMMSPVCVHRTFITADGRKKTLYFSPADADYAEYLNMNLAHKLEVCANRKPYREVALSPLYPDHGRMQSRDKYVTRFAGKTLITAWRGKYELTGDARDLTFLYDAGLGARNSQGFGMFRVI